MRLIIDRGSWLRGEGPGESRLIRSRDKKMCCLGFLGAACGIDEKDLLNQYTPETSDLGKWPNGIIDEVESDDDNEVNYTNSYVTGDLMETNDDVYISDEEREEELVKLFKSIGIEVEFVN